MSKNTAWLAADNTQVLIIINIIISTPTETVNYHCIIGLHLPFLLHEKKIFEK